MTEDLQNNFYFKYIDLKYDEADINRAIEAYPFVDNIFQEIDLDVAKELLPSIFAWFNQMNIEVKTALVIYHRAGSIGDIHKDRTVNTLAINIPLNPNAKNSITRFYELKDPTRDNLEKKYTSTNLPFLKYKTKDVNIVTYYRAVSPVLLNVGKIHGVINHTTSYRGVLSFRFKNNPWFLVNEEI